MGKWLRWLAVFFAVGLIGSWMFYSVAVGIGMFIGKVIMFVFFGLIGILILVFIKAIISLRKDLDDTHWRL